MDVFSKTFLENPEYHTIEPEFPTISEIYMDHLEGLNNIAFNKYRLY